MKAYHVTPRENLLSILVRGLVGDSKANGFIPYSKMRELFQLRIGKRVMLTNNPVELVKGQCGEDWVAEFQPVALEIELLPFEVSLFLRGASYLELLGPQYVPPGRLSVAGPIECWGAPFESIPFSEFDTLPVFR